MASVAPMMAAPEASEYAPYYGRYISLVTARDILRALEEQCSGTVALLSSLSERQGDYRYAPDKWSVKDVLGHVIDTERIFAYRALRIARNDKTPIEGFEQDGYVTAAGFGNRTLAGLIEEFSAVRRAGLLLFRSFDPEAWVRKGIASQKEISVRALVYVIAGHELHHRNILQEKYLLAAGS
jgi:hypothetical protein